MTSSLRATLSLAAMALLPILVQAEEPPSFGALYQEARQARERGDHEAYASRLATAVELLPAGDPNRPGTLLRSDKVEIRTTKDFKDRAARPWPCRP